jgi:hypothetical protein
LACHLDFGAVEQFPAASAGAGGYECEDGRGAKDFHKRFSELGLRAVGPRGSMGCAVDFAAIAPLQTKPVQVEIDEAGGCLTEQLG